MEMCKIDIFGIYNSCGIINICPFDQQSNPAITNTNFVDNKYLD